MKHELKRNALPGMTERGPLRAAPARADARAGALDDGPTPKYASLWTSHNTNAARCDHPHAVHALRQYDVRYHPVPDTIR